MTRQVLIPALILLTICSAAVLQAQIADEDTNAAAPDAATALDAVRHGRGHRVTVAEALARAEALHAQGDLERALRWVDRARVLILRELDGGTPPPEPVSNAAELREYLDLYGIFAYGRDPEMDAAFEFLSEQLALVVAIETRGGRSGRYGDLQVSTWTSGRIHRLGDVNISHWADGRIHRLGHLNISYRADGRPSRIAGIDYSYSAGSRVPTSIAWVSLP